ncbi:MAG: hypothetical protein HC894_32395 [Microcoleus sp. SM1_3_4]|nr:hypothetical protein [Microcoleus sp. SM1_3_4]
MQINYYCHFEPFFCIAFDFDRVVNYPEAEEGGYCCQLNFKCSHRMLVDRES